jgi:prevent-host-death family protein
MVNIMTMKKVNIFEAKAKLSEYVDAAERGERIVICRRNRPVAELRAVVPARTEPRPIGGAKGRLIVPDSFFLPLPDEMLDAFRGQAEAPRAPSHVAERRPRYRSERKAPRARR